MTFSLTFKEAVKRMAGWIESLVSPVTINLKRLFSMNFLVNKYATAHIEL